jgi:phospholipid transport system transporter-binding protein
MSDNEITVIDCGEALEIVNVGDMYERVLTSLAEGHTIQFNVAKIERIDTAAMQLIYAFSKQAGKHGHVLLWEGASEAFVRSANILGLAALMNVTVNAI